MNADALFLLLALVVASIFFVTEWLRADLVALLLLVTVGIAGILTPQEVLSGFGRSAVITILAIFILTAALEKTGVSQQLGAALLRLGGNTEGRMLVALMMSGAFLSLFMNNIAAGAVLLPAAVGIARERKISPSKLMMPLAFGTTLGGMATLLTTVNILANVTLRDNNLAPFGLFDYARTGIPLIFLGVAYMYFIGRRWLPHRVPTDWARIMHVSRGQLTDIYALRERWLHARVLPTSPLIGKTLMDTGLGRELGVNVLAILNEGRPRLAPPRTETVRAGDVLYLQARSEQVKELQERGLALEGALSGVELWGATTPRLFEVILSPRSNAVGKTLRELHFREKFDSNVVAIWREGKPRRVAIGELALQQGDALLVLGSNERMSLLQSEADYIVLADTQDESLRRAKAPLAAIIMIVTLFASASGIISVAEAMLAGALAMVVVRALTMDEAYQAIEWRAIFLIAAMLPVGLAMTKTGAAAWLGTVLVGMFGSFHPIVVLGAVLLLTMLLTQVMSGQATVVLLAPIALAAAQQMHANPRTFVMGAALAASLAFLTPLGHPINVLVMGPGGYKFADFFRVGALMTVISVGALLILLPIIWGL